MTPATQLGTKTLLETAVRISEPRSDLVELRTDRRWSAARRVKRVFDIAFASVFAVLALPFGVVIAIAILLETRGPVFFQHVRVGKGNRRFRLWKFRSMVVAADTKLEEHLQRHPELRQEWMATHKLKNDPRVTRVGRFLRSTSLDELPQIWNVLRGDMSMVGPRPIVEEEIEKYGDTFALYSKIKPGLTGLWQVSGRNRTSYPRRTRIDSEYIRNWTFRMDLAILVQTVFVVLSRRDAY